jgi:hypothetical protein
MRTGRAGAAGSATTAATGAPVAPFADEGLPTAAAGSAPANSTATVVPVACRASVSMRPPNRSRTHWSTKRFGAMRRSRPSSSAQVRGRIQVANCCGVSSCSNAVRQAAHAGEIDTECTGRRPVDDLVLRRDATAVLRLAGQAL